MIRFFKFDFPAGTKFLPKRVTFEVVQGSIGIVKTNSLKTADDISDIALNEKTTISECTQEQYQAFSSETKRIDEFEEIPSFLSQQPKWETGIFSLPYSRNACFFNPGLEEIGGEMFLFTRRYRYEMRNFKSHTGTNDLAIFKLNGVIPLHEPIVPRPPRRFDREQWEDPRAMKFGDECFISFSTYVQGENWPIRQSLCRLSEDMKEFTVVCEPDYKGNSSNPEEGKDHEKNWLWFELNSIPYCIYTLDPMLVFYMDAAGGVVEASSYEGSLSQWRYGRIRGGTPPVMIDGELFTFFHSSRPWIDEFGRNRRRYYMGALSISLDGPFKINRITRNPILIGSEFDVRELNSPLVVFPCGAKLIDDKWLVTMGINDEQCGWIKIPHAELLEKMIEL
jgi:predicted GH43/DUF377 family glycosyl hydrolase